MNLFNRIKKGLSWLGDRILEEVDFLSHATEGAIEYDEYGRLICEYVFVETSLGGYHLRVDRYGNPLPHNIPATVWG